MTAERELPEADREFGFETLCLHAPYQWFNFYNYWQSR